MAFVDLPGESWRDVPGYEGRFQASDLGRVRSLLTVRGKVGPYLIGWRRGDGRWLVTLSDEDGCRAEMLRSRVILMTFVGPCPQTKPRHEACHENDIEDDDRLSNLAWKTSKANKDDARRNGKMALGERRWNAKVTADGVREIRASFAAGESQGSIARRFGLTQTGAGKIIRRETWSHVE